MYFAETIDFLKAQGLIAPESEAVACTDYAVSYGGAIVAAIAMSRANYYILAANENDIRIFDIDKESGIYQNTFSEIKRADVKKAAASGLFGSKVIFIKANSGSFSFSAPAKIKGFPQKEAVARLAALIKTRYSKNALQSK